MAHSRNAKEDPMGKMRASWSGEHPEPEVVHPMDLLIPHEEDKANMPTHMARMAVYGGIRFGQELGKEEGYQMALEDMEHEKGPGVVASILSPLRGASMEGIDWQNAPGLLRPSRFKEQRGPTFTSRAREYVGATARRVGRAGLGWIRHTIGLDR